MLKLKLKVISRLIKNTNNSGELKSNKHKLNLASHNISSLIWKYFWPTVFASVLGTINNIVDRIYIGQGIGSGALAAITIIYPIMIMVVAFSALVTTGTSVLVATKLGEKDKKSAEEIFGASIVLSAIIGLICVCGVYIFKEPLLNMFGISKNTFGYAIDYLSILLWSWGFAVLGSNFIGIARSEGNVKIPMLATAIALTLNIIFDPIFIFALDMGVKGAAWASNITNISLFIWGLLHFNSKYSVVKIKISNLKINPKISYSIMKIGFAAFSTMLASSLVQVLTNAELTKHGDDMAVAVSGVIIAVMGLMMFLVRALSTSIQPIVSFNHGAKQYGRVSETLIMCMKYSTIISCIAFAVISFIPEVLVNAFNNDNKEFLEMGINGLRLSTLGLPLYGVMMVGSLYFTAVGQAKKATILSLLNQVILYIPALLIMSYFYKLNGAWLANSIAVILAAGVIIIYMILEIIKLSKLSGDGKYIPKRYPFFLIFFYFIVVIIAY